MLFQTRVVHLIVCFGFAGGTTSGSWNRNRRILTEAPYDSQGGNGVRYVSTLLDFAQHCSWFLFLYR